MTQRFSGRRIAVTGGGGGIGLSLCAALRAEGARVHALDRRNLDDLPEGVEGTEVDLTSEASVRAAVRSLYAQDGTAVELVTCAGVVEDDVAAEEMSTDQFDLVVGVNLRGVFLSCREFGRELLARGGGAIVNVASMSGNAVVNAPQRQSAYNTSKAGVSALTRSLAVEWGPRGVRVNAVSPGYVDTPLNSLKAHMHEQWRRETVLGRFAAPQEVAGAVAYLLSDEAAYCCGTELLIDGGFSLR
ncbi:SDR family NAD(P)-dependent oxidoreductase [Kineococcus indalonis]|uniref:SDR family NAD(P)-dependent oxidoreductase n=1 Tax=Kineococcus indalonis TaxID=2696566 RepID=UPI001411CDBE|nr:SDR family oxidoreductase [Kineococcus indalonis]NAZ87846.1 SDR family oxidoreductase [Kineococcus indalonis]